MLRFKILDILCKVHAFVHISLDHCNVLVTVFAYWALNNCQSDLCGTLGKIIAHP